jgi:uncharacterized protein (DUF433 family)
MSHAKTKRIVRKRGLCGGQPVIAGTRIRLQDVYVWHERQGLSADEIVSQFPQLSRADVYGALAYYWDHRDEMQRLMAAEAEYVERADPPPFAAQGEVGWQGWQERCGFISMSTSTRQSRTACDAAFI